MGTDEAMAILDAMSRPASWENSLACTKSVSRQVHISRGVSALLAWRARTLVLSAKSYNLVLKHRIAFLHHRLGLRSPPSPSQPKQSPSILWLAGEFSVARIAGHVDARGLT